MRTSDKTNPITPIRGIYTASLKEVQLFDERRCYTIGRNPQSTFQVFDLTVEWDHCRIERRGSRYYLTSTAKAGTYLNGRPIWRETELFPDMSFQTGKVIWVVCSQADRVPICADRVTGYYRRGLQVHDNNPYRASKFHGKVYNTWANYMKQFAREALQGGFVRVSVLVLLAALAPPVAFLQCRPMGTDIETPAPTQTSPAPRDEPPSPELTLEIGEAVVVKRNQPASPKRSQPEPKPGEQAGIYRRVDTSKELFEALGSCETPNQCVRTFERSSKAEE